MSELTCGECRYFRPTDTRDDGRIGTCRLQKLMGVFREAHGACPSFSRKGDPNPPVVVDSGRRSGGARRSSGGGGPRTPERRPEVSATSLMDSIAGLDAITLKAVLRAVMREAINLREADLGRGWEGGELELVPADDSLKSKRMTLEQFFHKLVMIRDNLRVLEQKVNSHDQLRDAEKVDLERRITLAYTAVVRAGTGWLPEPERDGVDASARALLRRLYIEAEWDTLALPAPPLHDRFRGGVARFHHEVSPHEEPIERFFHRLVLVRDRLMALEAQVAAHPHINPEDGGAMGSYIRRCYGTLTSFNVLFRERGDYFSSSR